MGVTGASREWLGLLNSNEESTPNMMERGNVKTLHPKNCLRNIKVS